MPETHKNVEKSLEMPQLIQEDAEKICFRETRNLLDHRQYLCTFDEKSGETKEHLSQCMIERVGQSPTNQCDT